MKDLIKTDNLSRKILIIGSNGFLGTNILRLRNNKDILDQKYTFIAGDLVNESLEGEIQFYNIDITNSENTHKTIVRVNPEVVILTAAMSNVDQNERNKELATKINTEGPINVLNACKKTNSKLLFISTDFVFDGISKEGNYNETDEPNPLNHYGLTKYNAEMAIFTSEIDYLICRTAVLYAWNKNKLNFITWILNNLKDNNEISIITKQINSATFVPNLAEILLKLIQKDARGIFHTTGADSLSRYDMALKCAEIFDYDPHLITPIKEIKQLALRPKNVGLDINKVRNFLNDEIKIFSLIDGLNHMKKFPPNHQ